jgi:hypothetical protein
MLSCPDPSQDPVSALLVGQTDPPLPPTGIRRLAVGAIHVAAVLSFGMLAAAFAVIGLIWFSMGLPNG